MTKCWCVGHAVDERGKEFACVFPLKTGVNIAYEFNGFDIVYAFERKKDAYANMSAWEEAIRAK